MKRLAIIAHDNKKVARAYPGSRYFRSACSARKLASCRVSPGERKRIASPCFSVFLITVDGLKYSAAFSG